MKPNRLLCLGLASAMGLSAAPAANAAEAYDACVGYIDALPAVLTTQGTWCLRKDLATAINTGLAIDIAANNVTVDCNDFKVGGLAAGPATGASGIGTSAGRSNFVVRRCNVRGFQVGVDFGNAGDFGGLVEDNRLDGNTVHGIQVTGSGHIVRRNRVTDTGGGPTGTQTGAIRSSATLTRIEDNTVIGVGSVQDNASPAGLLVNSAANVVRNNHVSGIVPNGAGLARGIRDLGGASVIEGNYLVNEPATVGEGITGNAGSLCLNNRIIGFTTAAISNCTDGGGNAGL